MGDIISPNDLRMPQGEPPQGMPPEGGMGKGMNPGGIEALKRGVQIMLKFMTPEELLKALLKMVEMNPDVNVGEDQLRQIIEQASGGAEAPPPEMGGGAPPMMPEGI